MDVDTIPESVRYMCRVVMQGHADDYRKSIDGEGMVVRIDPNEVDIEYYPGFKDVEALYMKFGGEETK